MGVLEALILGLVQGLTEFLPISSSGHLELGAFFLNVQTKDNLLFAIVVHGATALSTIVVFRKTIARLVLDLFKFQWNEGTIYVLKLAISMIPVMIVGLLFEDTINDFFGGKVIFVAFMLIVTGLLLISTTLIKPKDGDITYGKSILIGIAQTIAILPGISRSGATISTALISGVDKNKATQFSFLMVLAPIIGASLLKVKAFIEQPEIASDISATALVVGFAAAFGSGLFACSWMVKIVRKGKLGYFAIYCFVVAAIVLIKYWT